MGVRLPGRDDDDPLPRRGPARRDRLVRGELGNILKYLPLASALPPAEAVAAMPITAAARKQLLHILTNDSDVLEGLSDEEKEEYLYTHSYRDFLADRLGVTEEGVFTVLQNLTADSGLGIEATAAGDAIFYAGLPGQKSTGITDSWGDAYIHHR